ncbi:23S rRNA (pseudouridine(1915)-N(3))-methyltransferase RlmH [Candidatus Neptunochlamydia vexilliferae]|uniref:Ribosomal RNA large subunit methyltransferase H n=1 Tax=Candidatus Neptunichlamydia vexilliferae TaxID=1651774 RepID=A0ABS0B0Q9_9BACT|nr:23S rRNA (pseudouridine(1915)-N(3))-methyltransferase RlmH [Candidatus Neptunochlamydia vexilliferae]MBF5059952.1 Ribosomal RNA large subunit methyltransferase H [Candidatus Neptunochlamydia vexilliferae]
MLKIKIISPGKTKEAWLDAALAEYEKRLTGTVAIEWELKEALPKEPYICLDPGGQTFTSPAFSKFLYQAWERGGSRLTFIIGGPDGLAPKVLAKASHTISLSPLTFTHQFARLILLEQIYRAVQIEKGTGYHK